MKSLQEIEVEIKLIDERLARTEERIAMHERRLNELRAGHELLCNTPADVLAQMKKDGRL